LSRYEISRRLAEMGTSASQHTVRKLLKEHGLGQRKARKKKALGRHPDRDAQFQNIATLKAAYLADGDPVISMDTKKKELIGDFAREGFTHTQAQVDTLDHDFSSAGEGKLIPHGLRETKAICNSIPATIPASFVATVLRIGGNNTAASTIPTPIVCCSAMVAAATPVTDTSLRKLCKSSPINWVWKSVLRTFRRTAQSITPSTSAVSTHYPCLPRRGVSFGSHRQTIHGESKNHYGVESDGGYFDRRLRDRQKVRCEFSRNHTHHF